MDIRFEGFEFSFETLKLRKDGAEVRLVGQPLHLLVMLLQCPGVVVSREEIRQRLWPETHVDFDHSVHAALNRLRGALGDNGKRPRFIETIPTVGYRFLADVDVPVAASIAPPPPPPPPPPRPVSAARRAMWVAIIVAAAALLTYALVRQRYDKFVPRPAKPAATRASAPRPDRSASRAAPDPMPRRG